MLIGRSLTDLAREVDRQNQTKVDLKARAWDHFQMDEDGNSLAVEDQENDFPLTPIAHGQLAEFTGIPRKYYEACRAKFPELLATNVNHWLEASKAPRLIRTLDGECRAILSDRYRPLDNYETLNAVLPVLQKRNDLTVESCDITPRRLYLKTTTARNSGEVRKGDVIQFGLLISNSEIGEGRLIASLYAKRLVCLNGMTIDLDATKKHHLGAKLGDSDNAGVYYRDETMIANDRAFFLTLQDTVEHLLSPPVFQAALDKMRNAAGVQIEGSPVEAVQVLAKRHTLTEGEEDSILNHLIRGGDFSAWGMANAVTATANDHDDYDRASDLERLGGRLIDLDKTDWREVRLAA